MAAKAIINDPTLQGAWAELEDGLRSQWEGCILPRKRDRIWNELRHIKGLRHKLEVFAADAPRD